MRVLALLALAACAHAGTSTSTHSGGAPVGAQALPSATARDFTTAAPAGPILLVSGEPVPAIEAELERACRKAGLSADPRLAELAQSVARQSDGGRAAPRGSFVSYMGHRLGLVEPTPQLWLAGASRADMLTANIEPAVREAAQAMKLTHCGGALVQDEGMTVLAVAFSGRLLRLSEPVSRRVPRGTKLPLRATLERGYAKPALAVTDPQGATSRVTLPDARTIRHDLALDREGLHSIELLAEGPAGIAVIAVIPVMVGEGAEPAAPEYQEGQAETNVADFTDKLRELIAETRAKRNLPPLKLSRDLARIAQAHSEDMDAHRFVAHNSPSTGQATDRLARAGLKAQVLLENIGRGYSATEIHEGLMASPGHRANILHPEVRELGLGVVIQPEGERIAFLVTELFAKLLK